MEIDCEDDVCADPPQMFKPAHIVTLPNYNDPPYRNDIALIKLNATANITGMRICICTIYMRLHILNRF